ncbi:MAG: heparinase II/III-family protein, partial [Planctomycetes bacterium]|nr:heparinase II/III-family protein [Planctomycetota bacterium]
PLTFLAGGSHAAHFITRSGWEDGATIVALRSTDHYGDHNHYDQGSFVIYRNGLLAVDPPVYRRVRGPQQLTEHHNTLLLNGRPQRPVRGQWFRTIESFQENLNSGRMLETGEMLFHRDNPGWSAAACQFAQAYDPELVARCVRQLLLVRPGKVVVVDHLSAPEGAPLPEIDWLVQLPAEPSRGDRAVRADNGQSWIRVRPLLPAFREPEIQETTVNTHRVSFHYSGEQAATLVHLIEIGDDDAPAAPVDAGVEIGDDAITLRFADGDYRFGRRAPFDVDRVEQGGANQ